MAVSTARGEKVQRAHYSMHEYSLGKYSGYLWSQYLLQYTVCLPWTNNYFVLSFFYVFTVVSLKGMGKSFPLSKDEPLTYKIDGVMALWIFRRRA